jgi:hypothetical protein
MAEIRERDRDTDTPHTHTRRVDEAAWEAERGGWRVEGGDKDLGAAASVWEVGH